MSLTQSLILLGHYPPAAVLDPEETVAEAITAFEQRGVRRGVVVDDEGKLLGILSVRRILNTVWEGFNERRLYEKLTTTKVADIMRTNPPNVVVGRFRVEDVLEIMSRMNVGAVVVVDDNRRVLGIISERHIASILASRKLHIATHEVMSALEGAVLADYDPIYKAIEPMSKHRIWHIPIVDEEGRLDSLVTVHDVIAYLSSDEVLEALSSNREKEILSQPVSSIATGEPPTAKPDMDVGEALRLMRRRGLGGLPVVDEDGRPIGIISERDIVTKLPRLAGVEVFYDAIKSRLYVSRIIS